MHSLKLTFRKIIRLAKQAWSFAQSFVAGFRQWSRRTVLHQAEAERLDRIRNPSKYVGRE